ncbi:hypothetical protein [Amycolatopsis thermophila]|uniref:Uncharacterized protein n=1 Tax=Amycolatopsis thermophila TaxID=206084 RepID=A0ABU0EMK9_9PSEU|nr:hypothetical protein [Amycolatopsis thermophila]MDQ0376487.1 hypothetical protein [Amycolatopsis thermophila]
MATIYYRGLDALGRAFYASMTQPDDKPVTLPYGAEIIDEPVYRAGMEAHHQANLVVERQSNEALAKYQAEADAARKQLAQKVVDLGIPPELLEVLIPGLDLADPPSTEPEPEPTPEPPSTPLPDDEINLEVQADATDLR